MSEGYELVLGSVRPPAIIVHGGAGAYLRTIGPERRAARGRLLAEAARRGVAAPDAREAVLAAISLLEEEPAFNAGRGSKLQQDGRCRLSAALMDGRKSRLSAIYNVQGCLHPARLAAELQASGDRNLDGDGARELMAELGWPSADLRTPASVARWRDLVAKGDSADPEAAVGDAGHAPLQRARAAGLPVPEDLEALRPPADQRSGTVGAVAIDAAGGLWACTSTGGRGHERPGRVSDTPTPAGNYACPVVGLSATGFGEQILDLNLCGRIATRMLDGASLEQALRRSFAEVVGMGGLLGVIALTPQGRVGYAYTTEACGVAWADGGGQQHLDRNSAPT